MMYRRIMFACSVWLGWCGTDAAAVILPDALHIGSRAVAVAVHQFMAGRPLARDPVRMAGVAVAAGFVRVRLLIGMVGGR
jgi:hypothetical protein